MERLTEKFRISDGTGISKKSLVIEQGIREGMPSGFCSAIVTKCADYEDLEEQGLLPKLPCKVGDMMYMPHRGDVIPFKVISVTFYKERTELRIHYAGEKENLKYWGITISELDIGYNVFLTQTEAEEALKKMKEAEK